MISIIDYGAGNLTCVKKALDWLGEKSTVTSDPVQVKKSAKIILPGVGHFAATGCLRNSGLQDAIRSAISEGIPFLGICVGMQWIFDGSAESPDTRGIGLFSGICARFPESVKSPHVGWNRIAISSSSRLFRGVPTGSFVYFTHSFRALVVKQTTACCDYGGQFSAAVERGSVFGVQFHPEKSGEVGLQVLRSFCKV
jgi:imidazole glycerol-phosphate synthase subunit HisH